MDLFMEKPCLSLRLLTAVPIMHWCRFVIRADCMGGGILRAGRLCVLDRSHRPQAFPARECLKEVTVVVEEHLSCSESGSRSTSGFWKGGLTALLVFLWTLVTGMCLSERQVAPPPCRKPPSEP
ncbi:hypothetical protein ANANG_G00095900 [Anguilla anguilla]|uniref:Uncharacterized protein n=1 Tax=Anguilla anguilla TaxID=7936 RepID=A0A9D3MHW6_ANGAN|nr:hypothetical protein ANANG_G00095900 [Anguilla anguilla]